MDLYQSCSVFQASENFAPKTSDIEYRKETGGLYSFVNCQVG